jgi:hypothetical protein
MEDAIRAAICAYGRHEVQGVVTRAEPIHWG